MKIHGKMGENQPFLGIFEGWYQYQIVWYRYHIGSGRLVLVPKGWYRYQKVGTGTERLVPVPNVLFWTSVRVLAITWSFLIRFE